MKIIITERQLKLIERVIDNEVFCDKCNWNWSLDDGGNDPFICHKCGHDNTPEPEPNVFSYTSIIPFSIGRTKRMYFNNVLPLKYDSSIPDKIKLTEINSNNPSYILDKTEFNVTENKNRPGDFNGYVSLDYFKTLSTSQNTPQKDIESKHIINALQLAFPNNWVSDDAIFTPGIRGIYTIGDYLDPKTNEDWSILNYVDTKPETKRLIYDELILKNLPLDDDNIIDSISKVLQNQQFVDDLVKRQWSSIVKGEKTERLLISKLSNSLRSKNIKRYPPGSKMDRWNGVDVTIDGVNYQIKPLTSYKNSDDGYIVNTYGMRSYKDKSIVNKIAFANKREILIFDNDNYVVPSKKVAKFNKKNQPIIYK